MAQASTRPNDSEPFSSFQIRIDHSLKRVWGVRTLVLPMRLSREGEVRQVVTDLVRSYACTKRRSNHFRVYVLRQRRQVLGVEDTVLLETPVFVVKMVRRIDAVLLPTRNAVLTLMADS